MMNWCEFPPILTPGDAVLPQQASLHSPWSLTLFFIVEAGHGEENAHQWELGGSSEFQAAPGAWRASPDTSATMQEAADLLF